MSSGPGTDMEFLGDPPRRVPRWITLSAGVAVASVTLIGGYLWYAGNHAKEAVSQASLAAQQQAVAGQERVLSTLAYASPMIWSSLVPEGVRADLRRLVQASAADVVSQLGDQRETIANTRFFPWQDDVAQQRDEAITAIDAQLSRFRAVAHDARALSTAFAQPSAVAWATPRESEG